MTKLIFKTLAGSRLYGVETPESDYDYKGVFLESLDELLNKAKNVIQSKEGNTETELFSLNYYMALVSQSQVVPLDMLFAPTKYWEHSTPEWEEIISHRNKFVSSSIMPFVGYARGQAMKYGFKGLKLKTALKAAELVSKRIPFDKLCEELLSYDDVEIVFDSTRSQKPVKYLKICGKSFGETTDMKLWDGPLKSLVDSYGPRAALAISGADLKAQYHTVRICSEALELLATGELTFPRPEVNELKAIRNGSLSGSKLETLIETLFSQISEAEKVSLLPKEPDKVFIKQLVNKLQSSYLKEQL